MKYILILLACLSLVVSAASIKQVVNQRGQELIRIENPSNQDLYCEIWSEDGSYYVEFGLRGLSVSRWYFKPVGYFQWRCY